MFKQSPKANQNYLAQVIRISNTLSESISTDMVKEYMRQYTKRRDVESTEKNV